MSKIYLTFIAILFTGCASSNYNFMNSFDSKVNSTKKGYESSSYSIKKFFSSIGESTKSASNSMMENRYSKALMSDSQIIKYRKSNFIMWRDSVDAIYYNSDRIVYRYFRANSINAVVKNITLNQKMKIVSDHFYEYEAQKHRAKFQNFHKKPKFDEFLTDRENIRRVNSYKLELYKSSNEWDLKIDSIKRKITPNILRTVYGKPLARYISYDPYKKAIFLQIYSRNGLYRQKVSVNLDVRGARKMKANPSMIQPTIYFNLLKDNLKFVGISIKFISTEYLANVTDKAYQRGESIQIKSASLDLKKLDVDYRLINKNITPPPWFYQLTPSNGGLIGYGMGDSIEEAKNMALKEIAQAIEVRVNSSTNFNKTLSGDVVTRKTNSNISVETKNMRLQNTYTRKSQKKNGVWYVAVGKR